MVVLWVVSTIPFLQTDTVQLASRDHVRNLFILCVVEPSLRKVVGDPLSSLAYDGFTASVDDRTEYLGGSVEILNLRQDKSTRIVGYFHCDQCPVAIHDRAANHLLRNRRIRV